MSNRNQELTRAMETLRLSLTADRGVDETREQRAMDTVIEYIHGSSRSSNDDPFLPPIIVLDLLKEWARRGALKLWALLSAVAEDAESYDRLARAPGLGSCLSEYDTLMSLLYHAAVSPNTDPD